MTADDERSDILRRALGCISQAAAATVVAVAVHDEETGWRFSHYGDRLFHAASTIKVAILLALYRALDEGTMHAMDRLVIRNRFRSVVDGSPFQIAPGTDDYPELHRAIGRALQLRTLAEAMTIRSSNLAANLLLEHIGLDYARQVLAAAGVRDIHLRRGVEDERAFAQGCNNETTAHGLLSLFAALRGAFLSRTSREALLALLFRQRQRAMIPAGLPPGTRVAHKPGETSAVCHDAGIVHLPRRAPYLLAILTESKAAVDARRATVADIARAVYEAVTSGSAAPARRHRS